MRKIVIGFVAGFLLYLWQLPQHLLGIVLLFSMRARYDEDALVYIVSRMPFPISLGCIRILPSRMYTHYTCSKLFGYTVLSMWTGPLYIFLMGFPLIFFSLYKHLAKKSFSWYISKCPEKWAIYLGEKYYYGKLHKGVQ